MIINKNSNNYQMSLPQTFRILYPATIPGGKPRFEQIPFPTPGDNEVVVKIEYAPLNPSDIGVMRGYSKYSNKDPYPVGQEGSGTVVSVGTNLKVSHKVGDRVHVADAGTYGQFIISNSEYVSPILGDLSFEEAASHCVNPATVYLMGLKAEEGGHKAAIHTAGSSALGRMLIRYFKHKGIKLINIVRNDSYIEELKAEGADYVLNSQAPGFEAKLKELAEKENATIAFDAISGSFTAKVVAAQPKDSVCYLYGALEGPELKGFTFLKLLKKKSLATLLMAEYLEEFREKGELAKFFDEVHALLPTLFASKIQKVYKMEDLDEALAFSEKNSSKGKILFKLH